MTVVRPFLIAVLLMAPPFAACNGGDQDAEAKAADPPRLVRAVPAEIRQVRRELRTTGFLESERQGAVASRVPGRLRSLQVDAGVRVVKGEPMALLDDREARSAVQQLEILTAGRKVDLALASLEVEAAGRRVVQAQLEERRTKAEYDRLLGMDQEFVSPKALEDAEVASKTAVEASSVAGFNERKAELDVTRIGASVGEFEARIRDAAVRLEDHTVAAPFDGVVTRRYVAEGATIATGQVLFDVVDPERLVAWFDRPQAELEVARAAREVRFTTDALPDEEFTAVVDLVSPVVDRETGHFRVRVRISTEDARRLLPGMFLRARILAESNRDALMVPKIAVLSEGDIAVVMVVRNGRAIRVDLDPGLEQQDWIECRNRGDAGLQPGDLVVTSGHEDLKDQSPVEVAQD